MTLVGMLFFICIILQCMLCAMSLDRYIDNKNILSLFLSIFMFVMSLYSAALLIVEVLK
jgi:hypothetical protein